MHFELQPEQREDIESLLSSRIEQPPISIEELEIDCEGNPLLEELLEKMLDQCLKYTITIAEFKKIASESNGTLNEARVAIDKVREKSHDATIDAINVLSRELAKDHRNNEWAKDFTPDDRTKYMKFALLLTLSRI